MRKKDTIRDVCFLHEMPLTPYKNDSTIFEKFYFNSDHSLELFVVNAIIIHKIIIRSNLKCRAKSIIRIFKRIILNVDACMILKFKKSEHLQYNNHLRVAHFFCNRTWVENWDEELR